MDSEQLNLEILIRAEQYYADLGAIAREPAIMFRPKIFIDGDMWCALYGENLQEGVAGFGKTPYEAICAFNKEWHTPLK